MELAASATPARVIVMRHAEKPDESENNDLSAVLSRDGNDSRKNGPFWSWEVGTKVNYPALANFLFFQPKS